MFVIPAIDLMGGQVVRGVAGRRDRYRPIKSRLSDSASPKKIASALVGRFGFRTAYIADLDAIAGAAPAWSLYQTLRETGLTLWVDAGLRDTLQATLLAGRLCPGETENRWMPAPGESEPEPLVDGVIAGLETAASPQILAEMFAMVGGKRLIFSLDLRNGRPQCDSDHWQGLTVDEILALALDIGVQRFIVLDMARVGCEQGTGTEAICDQLRCRAPCAQIVAGGGVRYRRDLDRLRLAGCDAVLVASALHDGVLTTADIKQIASTA